MIKTLLVQLQLNPSEDSELNIAFQRLMSIVKSIVPQKDWTLEANAQEKWINLSIQTKDPRKLWAQLTSEVECDTESLHQLSRQWIVVCEGGDGWNDYLTLAHYDPTIRLDDAHD